MDEKLTDIETDCEELETGDEEIPLCMSILSLLRIKVRICYGSINFW